MTKKKKFEKINGTRKEVYEGVALKTRGSNGLYKEDLIKDPKTGKIKSERASKAQALNFRSGNAGAMALQRNKYQSGGYRVQANAKKYDDEDEDSFDHRRHSHSHSHNHIHSSSRIPPRKSTMQYRLPVRPTNRSVYGRPKFSQGGNTANVRRKIELLEQPVQRQWSWPTTANRRSKFSR